MWAGTGRCFRATLMGSLLLVCLAGGSRAWAAGGENGPAGQHAASGLPNVAMSMTAVAFAPQPVGTDSPSQTISLTNRSNAVVSLPGIVAIGDFTETNNCWSGVPPGGQCAIQVTFAPTAVGRRGGAVMIPSNPVQFVALLGSAIGPVANLSQQSLHFPDTRLGASSAPRPVVLANPGTAPLKLLSIAALGDFSETNDCGGAVAPHGKCTIQVSFTPTRDGDRSGAILVSDNSSEKVDVVLPSGTGTSPEVALSSDSVQFGPQPVGELGLGKELRLVNQGKAPLLIRGWKASSPEFAQLNNCPDTIPPQGQCIVQITFKPSMSGERTGTLTLDSNSLRPESIRLQGAGADFQVSVSPDAVNIVKSDSATFRVSLSPIDGFSGTVNLACAGAPDRSTCAFENSSVSLNGKSPVAAIMTVTPPDDHQDGTVGSHSLLITLASGTLVHHVSALLKIR